MTFPTIMFFIKNGEADLGVPTRISWGDLKSKHIVKRQFKFTPIVYPCRSNAQMQH
jgi:hypothetical protein